MEVIETNLKLSEAALKGNIEPKTCRILVIRDEKLCGCYLGSALVGVYGEEKIREGIAENAGSQWAYDLADETFPVLKKDDARLYNEIYDMNDIKLMSVEEISAVLSERGL